jgi:hypothetical protein
VPLAAKAVAIEKIIDLHINSYSVNFYSVIEEKNALKKLRIYKYAFY